MSTRQYGPGDIETWGQCSNPRDPRWVEPDEPETATTDCVLAVFSGRLLTDSQGRTVSDWIRLLDGEPLDPCDQSRAEIVRLIDKYRHEAPAAYQVLSQLIERGNLCLP